MITLADFVKQKRKEVNLTQEALSERAGVALTVVRKIEQGKENLNLQKVNQVLKMFGLVLALSMLKNLPTRINRKKRQAAICYANILTGNLTTFSQIKLKELRYPC